MAHETPGPTASLRILLLAAAIASGCGGGDGGGRNASHRPAPFPRLPADGGLAAASFGDGHDGDLTITSGTQTVNECQELVAAIGDQVAVDSGSMALFDAGDRVLIWMVQDQNAVAGSTGTVSFTGAAGTWEIARVKSVGLFSGVLDAPLERSYAQAMGEAIPRICTIPEYDDVTLEGGTLAASGGVLGFYARSLVVSAGSSLSADGAGFRGGPFQNGASNANVTAESVAGADEGGHRGEGIDASSWTEFGRGASANAGGGGNAANSGGGGGGNGGAGGTGGGQRALDGYHAETRGRGGSRVGIAATDRLLPGGGGGAGHGDSSSGSSGGSGGGIVLVFAETLWGEGTISSRGQDAADSGADGAGGGGAGGTIQLVVATSTFSGTISVPGGKGGSATDASPHGPGGGGGGGRILLLGMGTAGSSVELEGGASGLTGPGATDPWGASPGESGTILATP